MSLSTELRDRITELVQSNSLFLFMKGTRHQPQCGFSARVVGMLGGLTSDYETFDVLADPEVREGIKEFSNWPTIPQLYVNGEFTGGCDIVQEMFASGELHKALGVERVDPIKPTISITDSAAQVLEQTRTQQGADGGLHIENPNEGNSVSSLSAQELQALIRAGEELELIDVRSPEERELAVIEDSRLLDRNTAAELEKLPADRRVIFFCHTGQRSQVAAQAFAYRGHQNVYNLTGGIDAWSTEIDPKVPRY